MLIRKFLLTTTILVLSSLFLNACGAGTPTESQEITNTPDPTEPVSTPTQTSIPNLIDVSVDEVQGITIKAASAFVGSSRTAFNDLLAKFNTVTEWGIIVYLTEYNSYNTLFTEVSSSMDSSDQPDLVITLPEQILTWEPLAVMVELDPYLNDPRYGFSLAEVDDFLPIFWEMTGGQEKHITALPAEISASFLYYNQSWAHELGFNEAPSTFPQFRQQACAANEAFLIDNDLQNDGFGGWVVSTTPTSILAWMHAFDGGVMDSGNLVFSSDANKTALQSLKSLYDDHCAWISNEHNPYSSFTDRFALFITADLAELSNQKSSFELAGSNDEWTVLPFPGDHASLVAEGPSYSILATTPEQQLASWLFIRWMLSPENQVQWVTTGGLFPMQSSVIEALDNYRSSHPQWDQATSFMDDLTSQPLLSNWRQGKLVLGDAATFIFRTNQDTDQIKTILEQMDTTIQEMSKP
jgi:multiple sugar transport system substrate-binding protein